MYMYIYIYIHMYTTAADKNECLFHRPIALTLPCNKNDKNKLFIPGIAHVREHLTLGGRGGVRH